MRKLLSIIIVDNDESNRLQKAQGSRVSIKFLKEKKQGLVLVLITLLLITGVGVSGILSTMKTINSSGLIKTINIGVYTDSDCTIDVTSIYWGTLEPDDTVTRLVYIKNTGNANMTLYLSENNWTPVGASSFLNLSWDQELTVLEPGEEVAANIILTVNNAVTGIDYFSFQIVIGGTG